MARKTKPFVSEGRDLELERHLPARQRELIQELDQLRAQVARAQGTYLHRIRWQNLYATLTGDDQEGIDEAVAFLEDKAAQLQAELPAARRRGAEAKAQRKWESQALELDPSLSPHELERRYAGKNVWLWHGTSSELWPDIQREGLLAYPPQKSSETTPGFVYLTADPNHAQTFYARRAAAVFGGKPMLLRVAVPWDELEYDEDDADIPSGRVQFRLPRDLHFWEIREVDDQRMKNADCA